MSQNKQNNHKSNQGNSNKGTSGTNKTYDKVHGNHEGQEQWRCEHTDSTLVLVDPTVEGRDTHPILLFVHILAKRSEQSEVKNLRIACY